MKHEFLLRALLTFIAPLPSGNVAPQLGQPPSAGAAPHEIQSTHNPRLGSTERSARAVAAIEDLRSQLSTANSATAVLDRWCVSHGMAPAGAVVADKIVDGARPTPLAVRHLLRVGSSQPIGFRHVRLRCRDHILSEALLWYVPERLPSAVNRQLLDTDIPFGRAVAPLHCQRRNLAAHRSRPSEFRAPPAEALPISLFAQTALLVLPDGRPLAYVREVYLRGVLDFPAP